MVHSKQIWYRTYFSDFLANYGALVFTVMKTVKFLLSWQHIFTEGKSMLRKLYGEADVPGKSTSARDAKFAKTKFEELVRSRRELKS